MESRFYEFSQNNSGGSFDIDDKLCGCILIEAKDAEDANIIAESIGIYFDGCDSGIDCSCCGDRWQPVDESDDINLKKVSKSYNEELADMKYYAQFIADKYGWTTPSTRIFYLSGKVDEIFRTK
jgi:hypothetical protein